MTLKTPSIKKAKKQLESVHRRGDPIKANPVVNCLTCKRWSVCQDSNKKRTYACDKWREMPTLDAMFDTAPHQDSDNAKKGMSTEDVIKNIKARTGSEMDLEQMVEEALSSEYGMASSNIAFDDRDIPTPANFLQWITDDDYAGSPDWKPFSVQAKIATEFLGEFCPRCSDMKYLNNPRVDHSLDKFFERVQILEHGVCPQCKVTKSELILNDEMDDYYELAAVLGQRSGKCIEGSSVALTTQGLLTMDELFADANVRECGPSKYVCSVVHEAHIADTSHFYKSPPERLYEVTTRSGIKIAGTGCHPLLTGWRSIMYGDSTQHQFTKLKDITFGTEIPRIIGQDIWSISDHPMLPETLSVSTILVGDKYGFPKEINRYVRQSTRDTAIKALRILYESCRARYGNAEGPTTPNDQSTRLRLESLSPNVANQVAAMLSNLGIPCYIMHGRHDEAPESAVVIDSYYGLCVFANTIPLDDSALMNNVNTLTYNIEEGDGVLDSRSDIYPSAIRNILLGVMMDLKDASPNGRNIEAVRELKENLANNRNRSIMRSEVQAYVEAVPESEIKTMGRKEASRFRRLRAMVNDYTIYFDAVETVVLREHPEYSYDFTVPKGHRFIANGLVNHNTFMATMLDSYSTAKWLKLPSPQAVFKLPRQQVLTSTFVSLTFNQARENYWEPLNNFFTMSSWYQKYHEVLKYYGELNGEELYTHKDIFMRYRHRGLFLHPSGPNKRTLRGKTRNLSSIDEGGWFPVGGDNDQMERMSGQEVFKALQNSMVTLRAAHRKLVRKGKSHLPKPTITLISSPSEVNDLIMTKYRAASGSKTSYGIKKATWEVNPTVTKEDLAEFFDEDSVKAWRDFGAEPPLSSNSWIAEINSVIPVFSGRKSNITVKQKRFTNVSGVKQTSATINTRERKNGARLMALDAGYVNNSFAFAIGSLMDDIPIIESIGEIIPNKKAPISFSRVYREVLLPMIQENGVQVVMSDRWQNIKMMQDMEEEAGIFPQEYRLKYTDFDNVREAIYDNEIVLPKLEDKPDTIFEIAGDYPDNFRMKPAMHLLYQILTVRDYPGTSVEKGSKATDDIFRAVVLAYTGLKIPELAGMLNENARNKKRVLGAVSSGGGGGGKTSSRVGSMGGGSSGGSGASSSSVGYKVGRAD